MEVKVIAQSLANWAAISKQSDKLVEYLSQGNSFIYNLPAYAVSSPNIHAYPAIHNSKLVFLLIPSQYDNELYAKQISKYVVVCPVGYLVEGGYGSDRIPAGVAKARMTCWDENYTAWVPKQAASTDGIFMAFSISNEDFEVDNVIINLALKANGEEAVPFTADLVVTNREASKVYYDDFVTAVPPYGASAASNSFYLLSL